MVVGVKVLSEPQIMVRYIVLQALYKPKESVLKEYEKEGKYKKEEGKKDQHLEADDLMSNDPKMVSILLYVMIMYIDIVVRLGWNKQEKSA